MPEEGVQLNQKSQLLSTEEIVKLGRIFAGHGVNKIRLTGGEPLVRRDVVDLVKNLKAIDGIETVAMTTNGLTLQRHLPQLIDAGLDAINISLDTLEDKKFEFVSRRPRAGHAKVLNAIDSVLQTDIKLKINCVVMRSLNEDEILPFVAWTRDKKLTVRFIEYMPFDGNKWNDKKVNYSSVR